MLVHIGEKWFGLPQAPHVLPYDGHDFGKWKFVVYIFYTCIEVSVGLYHCLLCLFKYQEAFSLEISSFGRSCLHCGGFIRFSKVFTCSCDNSSAIHIWTQLSNVRLLNSQYLQSYNSFLGTLDQFGKLRFSPLFLIFCEK